MHHQKLPTIGRRFGCALALAILLQACGGGGGGDSGTLPVPIPVPSAPAPTAATYFPLDAENRWTYVDESNAALRSTERVIGRQTINGQSGFVVRSSEDASTEVSSSTYVLGSDGLWQHPAADADALSLAIGPLQLMRAVNTVGESFVQFDKSFATGFDVDGDGRSDSLTLTSTVSVLAIETVSTPAGTFTNSLHLRTTVVETARFSSDGTSGRYEIVADEWYAPDVGLVRSSVTSSGTRYATRTTTQSLAAFRTAARRSETSAPTVQSVAPSASGALASTGLVVTATFGEAMDAASFEGGAFSVTDAAGRKVNGNVTVRGKVATFVFYPWPSGSYTARISTAAEDEAGNALATERSWAFSVDGNGPAAVRVTPAHAAVDVALDARIVLEFDEPVDATNVAAGAISLSVGGLPVATTLSVSGSTVTLTPTAPLLPAKTYNVNISAALVDRLGNPAGRDQSTSFQTVQGRFDYPRPLITSDGQQPLAAIADFDGDGINDVVLTVVGPAQVNGVNRAVTSLFLRRGLADGSLAAPVKLDITLDCGAYSLVAGDLNGDGRADLAVGTYNCGVQLVMQTAEHTLVAGNQLSGPGTLLRIVDLNGDGRLDLVGASYIAQNAQVWRQDASGRLQPHSQPALGLSVSDFEVADLNGDGRPDLIVTGNNLQPGQQLALLYQAADGSFAAPVMRNGPSTWGLNGVAVGDLNGDGRNDVVATTGGNSPTSIVVYYQAANGELGDIVQKATYDIPTAIRVADINQDGRADVVVSHAGWNAVGLYLQQADGSLATEERYKAPYGSHNVHALVVGDLNHDGKPDIVIDGELLLQKKVVPVLPAAATLRARAQAGPLRLRGLVGMPVDRASMR